MNRSTYLLGPAILLLAGLVGRGIGAATDSTATIRVNLHEEKGLSRRPSTVSSWRN